MDTNINKTSTTSLTSTVEDYSVDLAHLDDAGDQDETVWDYPDSSQYLGYYKKIPELKKAIDALATWTLGKGFTTDTYTDILLDGIRGWGEDTCESILWNMLVAKKVYGDAFAEIIRDKDGELINLKPLNTNNMRVVVDKKGMIKRYELRTSINGKREVKKFKRNEIFHIVNDRIGDEIHGTSVIEACKWVIDARNEAMEDWRRISHRSTIRVIYVDIDNTSKIQTLKTQYQEAIKNGEVMILPAKRADIEIEELSLPPIDAFLRWIQYLENFFYQAVGIPKIILGGSEEFTEASSKIAYLTFEQVYAKEQRELESDIWAQLYLKLTFNKPASLQSEMLSSEEKNTGQTGFQMNDTTIGSGAA